jgi:hypothetical protein
MNKNILLPLLLVLPLHGSAADLMSNVVNMANQTFAHGNNKSDDLNQLPLNAVEKLCDQEKKVQ